MAEYTKYLIRSSLGSKLTTWYDEYQKRMHDIAY